MTTVAVMQPYFRPYAGYFRLFAAADCVAFEAQDTRLCILPAWQGPQWSILRRLLTEQADAVARETRERI